MPQMCRRRGRCFCERRCPPAAQASECIVASVVAVVVYDGDAAVDNHADTMLTHADQYEDVDPNMFQNQMETGGVFGGMMSGGDAANTTANIHQIKQTMSCVRIHAMRIACSLLRKRVPRRGALRRSFAAAGCMRCAWHVCARNSLFAGSDVCYL
jgi:hypothetical protein